MLQSQRIRKYNTRIIFLTPENIKDQEFRFIGLLQSSMISSEM